MHSSNKGNDRTDGKSKLHCNVGPTARNLEKKKANKGVRKAAREVERSPDPDAMPNPLHGSAYWD